MSEEKNNNNLQLDGLFLFKVGMSAVFSPEGQRIPVTVLRYSPMTVAQVKTEATDGYNALQVSFVPKRATRTGKAESTKLKAAGFENGARFTKELRFDTLPEGVAVGQKVALESLKKDDMLNVVGTSKGKGFQGPVRRWGFAGGPATHGSGFHRKPGSVGNRTWPGRVIAGKRMAGHWGDETVTLKNIKVVDVLPEENVLLVKGSVPGPVNGLIKVLKA